MNRLHDCPSCGREMPEVAYGADPECAVCLAISSGRPPVRRPSTGNFSQEATADDFRADPVATPHQGLSDHAAAALAGILVMGLGGLIVGAVISGGASNGFAIGALVGAVAGLVIGRVIARFEHVLSGAAVTGLIPIVLCLKDAIRRGRFQLKEFLQPQSLVVFGGIFLAGAALGALLVATRKFIVRLSNHAG